MLLNGIINLAIRSIWKVKTYIQMKLLPYKKFIYRRNTLSTS